MTTKPTIQIVIDQTADIAYVRLSGHAVVSTCQLNDEVLVDLDQHNIAVGIEVLRADAELPFDELTGRFHVHSDVVDLLRLLRPSVDGFARMTVSAGHDGSVEQRSTVLAST